MTPLSMRRAATVLIAAALLLNACTNSSTGTSGVRSTGSSRAPANSTGAATPVPNATESAPPGDIPDNQAFIAFTPKNLGYTVQVPEGWAQTGPGSPTTFTDKYNSIRIDELALSKAPTVASATRTELPAIKAANRGFAAGAVTTVRRSAGTAIKMTYRADSAPNPVTGRVILQAVERYEFWRAGKEVVFTLSSSLGSDNVDPWRKVTDAFRWTA